MNWRRPILAVLAACAAFVIVLAVAPSAKIMTNLAWPTWLTASISAFLALAAGLWEELGGFVARPLRRRRRRLGALRAIPGHNEQVQHVAHRLALNVHPAIPLPSTADRDLSDEFPEYVIRDIDAELRAWLRARTRLGGLVVLVGPAAAGKTRCLYEALRAEVPSWRMLQPSNGLSINELAGARVNLSRCVLWLDDLQKFFQVNQLTAATTRLLLARTCGPVLVAGTIRSEELDRLLTGSPEDKHEINRDSREILGKLARWSGRMDSSEVTVRFDIPGNFSKTEIGHAELLAARDPRLRIALRDCEEGNITATLAGAVDLIGRWTADGGDPSGQAVITAGVIARRCGHPDPIPLAVLQSLALDLLSRRGSAPAAADWLDAAVAWAEAPVKGQISAVRAVRRDVGVVDGYAVSDILVQHSHEHDTEVVSRLLAEDRTWLILLDRAPPPIMTAIGTAAQFEKRPHIAERAWLAAAHADEPRAMCNLAWLLRRQDKDAEAEGWLRRAVALDDAYATVNLAQLMAKRGDTAQAEHWFRKAVQKLSDSHTMGSLGFWLMGHGQPVEAIEWLRKAAALGDPNAAANLGFVLEGLGELKEAELWGRTAASHGHVGAMENLGNLYRARGDDAGALEWYRLGAERGYYEEITRPLRQEYPWSGEGNDGGVSNAIVAFADSLAARGDTAGAEEWYRRGAGIGDARAASGLAKLLAQRGDLPGADEWQLKAAELARANLLANRWTIVTAYGKAGILCHTSIITTLATSLVSRGEYGAAEHWFRLAASHDDALAMRQLAELMEMLGSSDEASSWLTKAAASESSLDQIGRI